MSCWSASGIDGPLQSEEGNSRIAVDLHQGPVILTTRYGGRDEKQQREFAGGF